jgi:hypothetical protein
MAAKPDSPRVVHVEWGKIDVAGRTYRDVKLVPGGARTWTGARPARARRSAR